MAITDNILIDARNLARNPIVAQVNAGLLSDCIYRVYKDDALLFQGAVSTLPDKYVTVDLSVLFGSLKSEAGVAKCRIAFAEDETHDDLTTEKNFIVYGGGISKMLQRKLANAGTDIFSAKLKNVNKNFFLTSRTSGRYITVPEDELLPLSFYAKGLSFVVKADGEVIATMDHSGDADESVNSVDFSALRKQLFLDSGKLLSVFDVLTQTGGYSCSLIITEVTEKHNFFLKFINAWGVWEKISIENIIQFTPELDAPEGYMQWDGLINDFVNVPVRKTMTSVYSADMGYKTPSERLFILDALMSANCRLVAYGDEFNVKISADATTLQSTEPALVPVNIKLQLLDGDSNFSHYLLSGDTLLATLDNELIIDNNFKIGI